MSLFTRFTMRSLHDLYFVAVLAGLIIFPAAFSVGIQPDAGPSLIFITLPNVFQQAFSGVPILAYIFSVMFFMILMVLWIKQFPSALV